MEKRGINKDIHEAFMDFKETYNCPEKNIENQNRRRSIIPTHLGYINETVLLIVM